MNELRRVVEFCSEHQLLNQNAAGWILSNYERWHDHPIRIVIQQAVDEIEMYKKAGEEFKAAPSRSI